MGRGAEAAVGGVDGRGPNRQASGKAAGAASEHSPSTKAAARGISNRSQRPIRRCPWQLVSLVTSVWVPLLIGGHGVELLRPVHFDRRARWRDVEAGLRCRCGRRDGELRIGGVGSPAGRVCGRDGHGASGLAVTCKRPKPKPPPVTTEATTPFDVVKVTPVVSAVEVPLS